MEYIKLTNNFELVLKKVMFQGSDMVWSKRSRSAKLFNTVQRPATVSPVLTISIKCLTHALWA
jgi:hypothetical protein